VARIFSRLIVCAMLVTLAGYGVPATNANSIAGNYGKLLLSLEANQGQADPRVEFLSRGEGYGLFLSVTESALVLQDSNSSQNSDIRDHNPLFVARGDSATSDRANLKMKFGGSNPAARGTGQDELSGKGRGLCD
jgi:hypothetical protein